MKRAFPRWLLLLAVLGPLAAQTIPVRSRAELSVGRSQRQARRETPGDGLKDRHHRGRGGGLVGSLEARSLPSSTEALQMEATPRVRCWGCVSRLSCREQTLAG